MTDTCYKNIFLSIVIAVYWDEEALPELYRRLLAELEGGFDRFEIIFIDDASGDRSYEILKQLYLQDERVRVIRMARNFGQANAIHAGLCSARGDIIVIMDSDLQDRPDSGHGGIVARDRSVERVRRRLAGVRS